MNNSSISKLFKKEFNINFEDMEINKFIDVSDYNISALSFDKEQNKNMYKKITKIIRKAPSKKFILSQGNNTIDCSYDHRVWVKFDLNKEPSYQEVGILSKVKNIYYTYSINNEWVETIVKKTNDIIDIFDIEVEDNHNYYSNNILSHNTIYGSPETTSGGNALKFYASIRMRVSRGGVIGSKDDPDGFETKVKLQKSKVSRPYNSITTNLYLGKNDVWGFSNSDEIIDLATEKEYITKSGAWFKFEHNGNEERFQGKDSLREYFSINTDAYNFFKDQVMSEFAIQNAPISEQAEEGSFNDVTKEKPERKKRKKKDDENLEEVAIKETTIEEGSIEIPEELRVNDLSGTPIDLLKEKEGE